MGLDTELCAVFELKKVAQFICYLIAIIVVLNENINATVHCNDIGNEYACLQAIIHDVLGSLQQSTGVRLVIDCA